MDQQSSIPCSCLREYIWKQLEEMFGNTNRWYTGVELGRSPDCHECVEHYIRHGGSENFSKKYHVVTQIINKS